MTTEVVDPTRDDAWDRQTLSHDNASIFHSAAWARVLTTTYGHRPMYLRCMMNGEPVAMLPLMELQSCLRPRRGVSLPFSDYCPLLGKNSLSSDAVFEQLASTARHRRWKYLELRGGDCVPVTAPPAVSFYSHQIDLRGGTDAVSRAFRPSVRQALRKARRGVLAVKIERSESAIRSFFSLHTSTRRRHGLPPQSLSFFLNIHREMISRDCGFVVVARFEGRPIAAMIFFHHGKTAVFKFGASDESHQADRPNHLTMAVAIESLIVLGIESLHLGRTSLSNQGLRRFKLTWGATEEQLHYYRYEPMRNAWNAASDRTEGLHTNIFRRLPLPLNRLAGALIYKHLD